MLLEKLCLPSKDIIREKPHNYEDKDEKLFKNEFTKQLPAVFPVEGKKSFIPPCGRLFNGLSFNLFQFNTKIDLKGLVKSYIKSFLFLINIRKITRFDKTLYITNSNSHNFFHWFLDVLQKLEFISQVQEDVVNSKLKIVIPNGHSNNYSKKSLEAFGLDFYYQKKMKLLFQTSQFYYLILLPLEIIARNLL